MAEEVVGGSTILIGGDADGFVAAVGSAIQAAERMEKEITSKVGRAVTALAGVTIPDIGKLAKVDSQAIIQFSKLATELKGDEAAAYRLDLALKGVNKTIADSLVGNFVKIKDELRQIENVKLFAGFEKSLAAASGLGEVEKRINALTTSMERLTGEERKAAEQALQLARAQEQASRTKTDNDNYVAALAKRTNAIGKSFAQLQLEEVALLKQEAAMRGVSAQAAPYIAKIEAAALATQKMGVSAGQTRQALAQLPAQFTDIFTSLAGGINPLLVLVQQGGQIKDNFGGIGNALKGILSVITPARGGLLLLAAAVAATAYAYKVGSAEQDTYAKGLILSGNAAGTTVGQLNEMAKAISASVGTQGKAAEVLAQLSASGTVAAGGLQKAAEAAIRLERAGGPAALETAKAMAELGKDPLQAVLKLNDGVNFLTVSLFNQVKALSDVGKTADAAAIALKAYTEAVAERAGKLEERLGLIEKAWRSVGAAAKFAWDRMLDIGRQQTTEEKLAEIQKKIEANSRRTDRADSYNAATGRVVPGADTELKALKERQAYVDKDLATTNALAVADGKRAEAGKALVDANKLIEASLAHQTQMQNDLAKSKETFDKLREGAAGDPAALKIIDQQEARSLEFIRKTSAFQQEMWARDAAVAQNAYQLAAEKIKAQLDQIPLKAKEGLLSPIEAIEKSGALRVDLLKAESNELQRQYALELQKLNNSAGQEAALGRIKVAQAQITAEQEKTNQAVRSQVFETRAKAEKAYEEERKKNNEDLAKLEAQSKQNTDAVALRVAQYGETLAANNELLKEEANLIGATSQERAIAVALMQVEITRKKQLADLAKVENLRPEFRAAKAQEIEDQATQARAQASAKIYLEAYQRVYDDISSGLADALMGGAKTAAAYIKDLFKSMVLKPIIQATLSPVTGAITNAITGGIGGGIGLGSLSGLGGLNGGITGFGFDKFATSSFGQSLGLSSLQEDAAGNTFLAQSGFANSLGGAVQSATAFAGYLDAAFAAKAGKWGTALGEGFGTYVAGPVGAFIGKLLGSAVDSIFSGGAGTPHTGGYLTTDALGNVTDITKQQGGIQNADVQKSVAALALPLTAALNATAKTFGQEAGYGLRAVFEADGKDAAEGLFQVLKDGIDTVVGFEQTKNSTLASDPSKAFTQFSDQAAQAVRVALLKLDLPTWAKEQLNALGDAVSASDLANGVKAINDAQAAIVKFTSSLKPMTGLMGELGALSSDAVYALAKMSGGIDVLSGNLSTYYQAFYSDAEQSANSLSLISATLKDVGLAVPDTRESFRALVEAQDLTSESGQKAFTALLSVSGAFDKLIGSAEQAQIALDKSVETNRFKFLSPEQQAQSKYQNIAGSLFGAGVGGSYESVLQAIIGASKDDIYAFAQAFLMIDTNSVAAKTAVVNAAGALYDLKDAAEKAADAAKQAADAAAKAAADELAAKLKAIASGVDGIAGDFLSGSALANYKAARIQQTLSEGGIDSTIGGILGATKDDLLALWNAVGVDGKQAILNAYGAFKDLQDILYGTANAVKQYRSTTLADAIEKARLDSLSPAARIASLKSTEANLFGQLATTDDPVAVAEKLQSVIISRIQEETSLRDKLNATTNDALNKQIDALKNMKGLANDIAQFTGSISFSDLSPLNPLLQVGSAQSLYEKTLASAKSGDAFAQGNLLSNARAYLEEAASAYASGPAYASIFDRVTRELNDFGKTAGLDVSPQLKALQDQVDSLDDISGYSKDMLDALLSIDRLLGGRVGESLASATSDGSNVVTPIVSAGNQIDTGASAQIVIAAPKDYSADIANQTVQLTAIAGYLQTVAAQTSRLPEAADRQVAHIRVDQEGFLQLISGVAAMRDELDQIKSELKVGGMPA